MDDSPQNAPGAPASIAHDVPSPAPAAPPRRVGRIVGWLLFGLAVAGFITAGVFGYRVLNRGRVAEADLARASAILEEAESDLLVVDDAVQAEISAEAATSTAEAAELVDGVREDALEASEIIGGAMGDLPEDMLELAEALKESADARVEMMDLAPAILEADLQAATAIPFADRAVAEIKTAEDLSAQAVVEFNKHTAASVKASDDLSVQAETHLQAAQSLVASATASFPGADFSAFSTYVDAKVALIALAKEIDALWLAGNIAGSNEKLTAYNQRDAEVVALAQALPASVRDPIANAYNTATAEASTKYFEARERARAAGERVSTLKEAATD